MTDMSVIPTRASMQVRPYEDSFGIGQAECARIRLAIAKHDALKAAANLLSTEGQPLICLPMWSRTVRENIAEIERARAVIGGAA